MAETFLSRLTMFSFFRANWLCKTIFLNKGKKDDEEEINDNG